MKPLYGNPSKYNTFEEYYKNRVQIKNHHENIPEAMETARKLLQNINYKRGQWLITKINNHIERYMLENDTTVEEELKKIVSSKAEASKYAKPATKQNQSEHSQIDFLIYKGIPLTKLNATGDKSLRFVKKTGELVESKKVEKDLSHSIDYEYKDEHRHDLIMAKVTTKQGGAQNNQREEILYFLEAATKYMEKNNTNTRIVVLLDGDNYSKPGGMDSFLPYASERIIITNSDNYDPRI